MKIKEKIHDIQTGEETIIEREETEIESASRLELAKMEEAKAKEAATKATAKAALLKRLGITADEAALLLS